MKKRSIVLAILSLLVAGGFASIFISNIQPMSQTPPEMLSLVPGESYEKDWKRVDSLDQKGLPESALKLVNGIYDKAKAERNHPQQIKAIFHILKYNQWVKEEAIVVNMIRLKEEIDKAEFPVKPVLQSVLAQNYWSYYQQNTWRFQNRTETVDLEENDVRTWDLRKIITESTDLFLTSLENVDSLRRTEIGYLEAVLVQHPEYRHFRPSLYDLLARRALEVLENDATDLPQPAYQFRLEGKEAFGTDAEFSKATYSSKDTNSFKLRALHIYQELTMQHLADTDPTAKVFVALDRLNFARSKSILPEKEQAYLQALERLAKANAGHEVSTWIQHKIALFHRANAQKYEPRSADQAHKDANQKALEVCDAAIKAFPESDGAQACRSLKNEIGYKQLSFTTERINPTANGTTVNSFRGLLTYRNLNKVWCRVVKVNERDRREIDELNQDKKVRRLLAMAQVTQWGQELPADPDYNQHTVEIGVPALENGYYAILISDNEKFATNGHAVTFTMTWASRLAYISREFSEKNSRGQEFFVTDRTTGAPLGGVRAKMFMQEYNYSKRKYIYKEGKTYTSDRDGYFKIEPGQASSFNYYLEMSFEGERIRTEDTWYQYGYHDYAEKPSRQTIFFTDRGIYRPGQTVYFKAIVLEKFKGETKIVPNYSTTVYFRDPNNQEVASLNLRTNEFGTFHGSFTAPHGQLNGNFTLRENHGSGYVSVEDYKRPKFEVTFEPIKGSFRLSDEVKVQGKAEAYAGSSIDGAEVKYRVVRTASFPWWGYWFWGRIQPSSAAMEITSGTTVTDGEGGFEVDFQAIPDPELSSKLKPQFSYTVYADVVDITGETHSSQVSVQVGYIALNADLVIPGSVERGRKDGFAISTKNLNGQFEAAKGTIAIHKLNEPDKIFRNRMWATPDKFIFSKEEYYQRFPQDVYEEENQFQKWEKGKEVYSESFDSEKNDTLELKGLKNWEEGKYVVEMLTRDKFGEEVKVVKYFTLYDKQSQQIPLNLPEWYTAVKATGEPGETASLVMGTAHEKAWVLYEIEKKGEIVSREWLNLRDEKRNLEIPITEADRGNFAVHLCMIKDGRLYSHSQPISVPWTNKELDIEFETFRDKLQPGQKEEWNIKISGPGGDEAAAEMVAAMYDASLDAFRSVSWGLNVNSFYYSQRYFGSNSSLNTVQSQIRAVDWNNGIGYKSPQFEYLNPFGYYMGAGAGFGGGGRRGGVRMKSMRAPGSAEEFEEVEMDMMLSEQALEEPDAAMPASVAATTERSEEGTGEAMGKERQNKGEIGGGKDDGGSSGDGMGDIKVRTNLNETAFFFPQLRTNEKGEIIISYTVPEALTRWRIMMLAHTKDLKTGYTENSLVTQKELMVMPNPPRFFRENDDIEFTAKVSNLSDKDMNGTAVLELFDGLTMKPIDTKLGNTRAKQSFKAEKGRSAPLAWRLKIPSDVQVVTFRVKAKAGNYSDGEESSLPVLRNSMLVTESMPLPVRPKETRTFTFDKLVNNKSTTLKHHKYTLEFTSNPAWYAVQALPYLMEYPYECTEQVFSRYYANALASHIANSHPRIKRVFESWKTTDKEALLSNLEKNQELKALLLEETPWVLNAQSETERKKRVGLLFDLNKMADELNRALTKIQKAQVSNGGWPWFPGMPENRYITQHVVTGMGHLDHLGVKSVREDKDSWRMIQKAVGYLDIRIREDYEDLLKYKVDLDKQQVSYNQIHYLYARSYFTDIPVDSRNKKAIDYYREQTRKYWLNFGHYPQGMIALALHREKDQQVPQDIVKSLKEHALNSDEMGMYWKRTNRWCLYWYQAPIETQALLIEVFDEVADDKAAVEEMKIWLLKQKQTQDWKTTKATVEACYALLLQGTDLLAESQLAEITVGGNRFDPIADPSTKVEAGTGYFKTSWGKGEITPKMGEVKVKNNNNVVAWGAVYWQYFEQLDKITFAETNLKLQKKLFVEENSPTGPKIKEVTAQTKLKPGDKLKVRIILESDRDLEYVHLKDMRASGFEPINVISRYKYQDGLGYYESTRDAATNFFIQWLPKGKFVFEYPLRVIHKGDFSNGITTLQCMYAPEFTAHSEGVRVKVE